MARITQDDITDNILSDAGLVLTQYYNDADDELLFLALEHGLEESDIFNPVRYKVKKWMVAYICMQAFMDLAGTNDVELFDDDKYWRKYKEYKEKEAERREGITREMLENDIDNRKDVVPNNNTIERA